MDQHTAEGIVGPIIVGDYVRVGPTFFQTKADPAAEKAEKEKALRAAKAAALALNSSQESETKPSEGGAELTA